MTKYNQINYTIVTIILDNNRPEFIPLQKHKEIFNSLKNLCKDDIDTYNHINLLYNYWFNKEISKSVIEFLDFFSKNTDHKIDNSLILAFDKSIPNNIIGFISYYINTNDSILYISRIYTDSNKRRKKIGTIMMRSVLNEGTLKAIEKTYTDVNIEESVITFFTKLNFIIGTDHIIIMDRNKFNMLIEMRQLILDGKGLEVIQNEKYKIMQNSNNTYRMLCFNNPFY